MRGDDAFRLVIAPELRGLGRRQRLAVDEDFVTPADFDGRGFEQLAVDADAAVGDPTLCLAARAQAGVRHRLGDAHRAVSTFGSAFRGARFGTDG